MPTKTSHVSICGADEYASPDAASDAIQALTDSDHKKLMIIATSFWNRRRLQSRWAEPADLLHDAMLLTLQGKRRWRRGKVDVLHHLDRTMESLSGHLARKGETDNRAREAIKANSTASTKATGIQSQISAREELGFILALFSDDQTALSALELRAAGYSASEIRAKLGIGCTAYETICRRIRRKLVTLTEQGD